MLNETRKAWVERTFLERTLLAAVLFLTLIIISLITVVALFPKSRKSVEYAGPICRSKGCVNLSRTLLKSMNTSQDPCDDFYVYSCGGWLKDHQVPPDTTQYSFMEILKEDVLLKLKNLLSVGNETFIKSSAVQNALQFYNSCIYTDSVEEHGTKPLINFLDDIGGWPVANITWNSEAYDWLSAIAKIQLRTGFGYVISIIVGTDARDTSKKILQLDRPTLVFPRSVLKPENKADYLAYRDFFRKIMVLMGAEENEVLNDDFEGMVRFEDNLTQLMRPEEELKDVNSWYNKMNITELCKEIPEVNWLFFLQQVTNSTLLKFGEDSVITASDEVIIRDLQYIQKLSKYMKNTYKYHQHSPRQLANYLGWRVVLNRLFYLPAAFRNAVQNYTRNTGSQQEVTERWKICTNLVNSAFSHATSLLFVRKYFQKRVRNEVSKLVEDMRFQFGELIDENEWMDPGTKRSASEKLAAMKANVGYPEWISDEELVDKYYQQTGMPEMTGNLLEDDLAISEHDTMNVISTLRKPNNRKGWPISPVTVNAAYNRNLNEITFPAAFLQWPMYNYSVPEYYNFAAIGSVIGHEMTHGFDNEGRQRDANGRVHNWWSERALEEFKKQSQCFISQYNYYKGDGVKSLAENIADNGGLRQSYQAFLRWKEGRDVELLPEFQSFTSEQLFFISYGSIWCTKYAPRATNPFYLFNEHPPSYMRLWGTVSNLKEFSEAFNCKPMAFHNPEKRCIIW